MSTKEIPWFDDIFITILITFGPDTELFLKYFLTFQKF